MKTNKILQKALLALAIVLFSGCSDNLDVVPESKWEAGNFYSTREEVNIALAGIYGTLASSSAYGGDLFILSIGTDEAYYNRRFGTAFPVSLAVNTPSDNRPFNVWSQLYQTINLTNLFLENLSEDVIGSEEDFNAFAGEARFLRALAYLNLTQLWNEVPLRLTSTKTLDDNNVPAASLEDVYAAITDDFKFAAENLPLPTDENYIIGRAHRYAANGLLARTYLKMSGAPFNGNFYQEALDQCKVVMESGFHGLTPSPASPDEENPDGYQQVFLDLIGSNYNLREVLFEISFQSFDGISNTAGRHGALWGITYAPNSITGAPSGFSFVTAHVTLDNLYDVIEGDFRYDWNIAQYSRSSNGDIRRVTRKFGQAFGVGKYKRWKPTNLADIDNDFPSGCANANNCPSPEGVTLLENNLGVMTRNTTSANFPVVRYSDVLLMYAEASNELNGGPTAEAISAVNAVRNRAGAPSIGEPSPTSGNVVLEDAITSKENFFRELVNERSRELCFEGLRRRDLVRWGLLGEKLAEVRRTVANTPGFAVDALRGPDNFDPTRHLSLPYPLIEVNGNQALDQKPEW